MDSFVVEGIYEDGKIELEERPAGVARARVRVTFLPDVDSLKETEERKVAGERALARMKAGINFGGAKFNREEIYEERMRELDERSRRRR
ncbi:MAG TPA: hypothetical protein VFJ58_06775 [Armatimonadota bacterium]|nr:hypothetical protein [Armatimonadota bacterium]